MWASPWAGSPAALARVGRGHPRARSGLGGRSSVLPSRRAVRQRSVPDCGESPLPPEAGAGHRCRAPPPPRGSPRPPSPPPAPARNAVPGPSPLPCSGRASPGGPSRCGAHRDPEAEPLLPRDCRGPSHRSLRSHPGFAKSFSLSPSTPPALVSRAWGAGWSLPGRPSRLPAPSAAPLLPSAGQRGGGHDREVCRLPHGRAPGLEGLGQSGASTRASAFPLPEPQRSVWSPGAAEPVPEEKGRAGKGAILPGKGARQHIKESCSFLSCLVRKSTQIIKNIYTFSSWKRRVVSGFIIWQGLINTKWLHQMTEQKREEPFPITLEFTVQGGESEAVSVPCPPLPGTPLRAGTHLPRGAPAHCQGSPAPGQPRLGDF